MTFCPGGKVIVWIGLFGEIVDSLFSTFTEIGLKFYHACCRRVQFLKNGNVKTFLFDCHDDKYQIKDFMTIKILRYMHFTV